jgi:hypothetical protein
VAKQKGHKPGCKCPFCTLTPAQVVRSAKNWHEFLLEELAAMEQGRVRLTGPWELDIYEKITTPEQRWKLMARNAKHGRSVAGLTKTLSEWRKDDARAK